MSPVFREGTFSTKPSTEDQSDQQHSLLRQRLAGSVSMSPSNDRNQSIRFSTYWNYLRAIRQHVQREYGPWQNLCDRVLHSTRKLQGMRDFDTEWIRRHLRLAWNTEYLLEAGPDDPELIQLTNHWAPVQAYYAVYCAMEAAAYALNESRPEGHSKALRVLTDYWTKSGITPWDKAYSGPIGKSEKDHQPVNFPSDLQPAHNLKRRGVNPLSVLATCLRAEHKHRVDAGWDSKSSTGCWRYEFDPGKTGLAHFLYRLRLKANYRDIDLFLAEVPERRITEFNRALREIVSWSLLYLEVILARRVRKATVVELGKEYLEANEDAESLENRLNYYESAI